MESWYGDEEDIYNSDTMNLDVDYFLGDQYCNKKVDVGKRKEEKEVCNGEEDDIYSAPLACPSMEDYYDFCVDHKTAEDDIMNLDLNHFFDQDKSCNIKKRSAIANYKGKGKDFKTVLRVLKHDAEAAVIKTQVPDLKVTEKKEYDQRGAIVNKTVCTPVAIVRPRLKILVKKQQMMSVVMGQNSDYLQKNELTDAGKPEKLSSINSKDCNMSPEVAKRPMSVNKFMEKGKEFKTVLGVLKADREDVPKAEAHFNDPKVIVNKTICPPVAKVRPRLKIIVKKQQMMSVVMGQNSDSVQKNELIDAGKPEKLSSINNKDCNMNPEVAKRPMSVNKFKEKGKEFKTVLGVLKADIEDLPKAEADLNDSKVIVNKTMCPPPAAAPVAKERPRLKLLKTRNIEVVAKRTMPINKRDFELKIEATKRKLHDSYELANNQKRQRSIQLIDFHQLPPVPTNQKQRGKPQPKPKVSSSCKFSQGSTERKRR